MYIPVISEIGQMISTVVNFFTASSEELVAKRIGVYSPTNEVAFRLDPKNNLALPNINDFSGNRQLEVKRNAPYRGFDINKDTGVITLAK